MFKNISPVYQKIGFFMKQPVFVANALIITLTFEFQNYNITYDKTTYL